MIVTTPQLPFIAINHSIYLDFVKSDGTVVGSIALTECGGILSGEGVFPSSVVFYQLRGSSREGDPFAHVIPNSEIEFQAASLVLDLAYFEDIPINIGQASYFKMSLLYNNTEGSPLIPSLKFTEPTDVSIIDPHVMSILPGERQVLPIQLRAGNTSLIWGNKLPLVTMVTENCSDTVTTFTHHMVVYPPISMTVVNVTGKRLLAVQWNRPPTQNPYRFQLTLDFDNETISHVYLPGGVLQHFTRELWPYQRVYIGLAAVALNTSDVWAFAAPREFRSSEASMFYKLPQYLCVVHIFIVQRVFF